ncbi:hypothetical protein COCC4DRAFT_129474 [Bipolaris maydis ATCC 48331]|uniref:Uncharacterized protein n=2 Tax=Cochliobolus heterostrophus TaxID=5016 RepID=M2UU29_COCH5|nr:uncharacterized protein COCC4DRAFT_129474 [Bipolaris maydis ATCC 48331]EMD91357.1 hypothetical protein COCHEDRAFT_1021409 [Bipolaris maydis C5]ENI08884.1 hypothetical protein COCC4DRAFT_129474 [Bipolaris maydis ATCC 48331]
MAIINKKEIPFARHEKNMNPALGNMRKSGQPTRPFFRFSNPRPIVTHTLRTPERKQEKT